MSQIPMQFKLIGFTGDYSKLKDMGFVFQKLYASNYMQWHHEDSGIRIWKKGADLTIEHLEGMEGQLLQMLIDHTTFTTRRSTFFKNYYLNVYKHRVTNELSIDHVPYETEDRERMLSVRDYMTEHGKDNMDGLRLAPTLWTVQTIPVKLLEVLQRMGKLGWLHVRTVESTHFVDSETLEYSKSLEVAV